MSARLSHLSSKLTLQHCTSRTYFWRTLHKSSCTVATFMEVFFQVVLVINVIADISVSLTVEYPHF